jgi:hypothetical protein
LESACPLTTKAGAKRRFNLANDSCQIASAGPLAAAKSIRTLPIRGKQIRRLS